MSARPKAPADSLFPSTTRLHRDEVRAFRRKLFKSSAIAVTGLALVMTVSLVALGAELLRTLSPLLLITPGVLCLWLLRKKREMLAGYVLLAGVYTTYIFLILRNPPTFGATSTALAGFLIIAGFVYNRTTFFVVLGANLIASVALNLVFRLGGDETGYVTMVQVGVHCIVALAVHILARNRQLLGESLEQRLTTIEGALPDLSTLGIRVSDAARELGSNAANQRQGATRQSSAVEETRKTLHGASSASEQIAASADRVFRTAESTLGNNERVERQIGELSAKTDRIGEILETISQIARRSELLALNAALEGVKAGEAGAGFGLVAGRMQQLAENVSEAVVDIRQLTEEIQKASESTQGSVQEGTRLADSATAASREISEATRKQASGAREMAQAMDDIAQIANDAVSGGELTLAAAKELQDVADELPELIERLQR